MVFTSRGLVTFGVIGAALAAAPALAGDTKEKPPAPRKSVARDAGGFAPGDRFTVEVSFKDDWLEGEPSPSGGAAAPGTQERPASATTGRTAPRVSVGPADPAAGWSRGPATSPAPIPQTFTRKGADLEQTSRKLFAEARLRNSLARAKTTGRTGLAPMLQSALTRLEKAATPTELNDALNSADGWLAEARRQGLVTHEPLEVDMTFHATALGDDLFAVVLDVSRVHYWDSKPRDWTVEPATAEGRDAAAAIARSASADWRRDQAEPLERDMDEDQLLGAGVALVGGLQLTARIARGSDPALDEETLDAALEVRLPQEYPAVLRESVVSLLREACRRVRAPAPPSLAVGTEFESLGIAYRVTEGGAKTWSRSSQACGLSEAEERCGATTVEGVAAERPAAACEVAKSASDKMLRDELAFDARTGLVLEGRTTYRSATLYRPRLHAPIVRASTVTWRTRLLELRRAGR